MSPANMGNNMASTRTMKRKMDAALPRNIASRLTGASSSPSSPPCSRSLAKARLMARTPAKAKEAQRIPGATVVTRWGVTLNAKLKTTTSIRPKTSMETISSRERSSNRMSFHTNTPMGLRKSVTGGAPMEAANGRTRWPILECVRGGLGIGSGRRRGPRCGGPRTGPTRCRGWS